MPDHEAADIVEGFMMLAATQVQQMFDPVVTQVIALVEDQVSSIHSQGRKVSATFSLEASDNRATSTVVCKTGSSAWVRQGVNHDAIEVMQPTHAWTAVVRGAVLRGLEGAVVHERRSRYHYGTKYAADFDKDLHSTKVRYWDPYHEIFRARGCMRWYVAKKEAVSNRRAISFPFVMMWSESEFRQLRSKRGDSTWHVSLYACIELSVPIMFSSNFITVCTLTTDLADVPRHKFKLRSNATGMRYRQLDYVFIMKIDSASFKFDLSVEGKTYGSVTSSFKL